MKYIYIYILQARMDVPSEDYYSLVDYPEGYTGTERPARDLCGVS